MRRHRQRGIVPYSIRQIYVQTHLLGSLLAGINFILQKEASPIRIILIILSVSGDASFRRNPIIQIFV